jgi:hypothetical protein
MSIKSSVWYIEIFGFHVHFYTIPLDQYIYLNIKRYPSVDFKIKIFPRYWIGSERKYMNQWAFKFRKVFFT